MATVINRNKALLAASKRLAMHSDKQILRHLDFAGMDALEAYKCGVEEAQGAIVDRLATLPTFSLNQAPK